MASFGVMNDEIIDIMRKHNITLPKAWNWLPCKRKLGAIIGLPSSRGHILATDGILCLIDRHDGAAPYMGHFGWFKKEARGHERRDKKNVVKLLSKYGI